MLVLSRKHNETLHIGNDIVITIVRVRGDSVRIGIQAPKEIHIMRSELLGTPAKPTEVPEPTDKPIAAARHGKEKKSKEKNSDTENGPLAAFLKAFPKVELATAS